MNYLAHFRKIPDDLCRSKSYISSSAGIMVSFFTGLFFFFVTLVIILAAPLPALPSPPALPDRPETGLFCMKVCANETRVSGKKDSSKKKTITLVLDPGHGGGQSGAGANGALEKNLNLDIAQNLKEILESDYKNIKVSLTRDDDYDVGLKDRVEIAAGRKADMLISLHNNARGDNFEYKDGCTVLTAQGNYKPELALEEQKLACCVLNELADLGLNNRGILMRDSETGDTYEDESIADYYAIIRAGINLDVPSVIIEHAFMDEENDFENHLSSKAKLRELAQADARGIAAYFGLSPKKGKEKQTPPADYEVVFYHMHGEDPEDLEKTTHIFYPTDENLADGEEISTSREEQTEPTNKDKSIEDPAEQASSDSSTGNESTKEKKGSTGMEEDPSLKNSLQNYIDQLRNIINDILSMETQGDGPFVSGNTEEHKRTVPLCSPCVPSMLLSFLRS